MRVCWVLNSIKALLLETIDSKDFSLLTNCYSSILQINPSSSQAIDSLIRLHAAGIFFFLWLVYDDILNSGGLKVCNCQLNVWVELNSWTN